MRILYVDIDSLRPDHLGCYGYRRRTSPNLDALAARGTRFERVYVSDAPCLPSRTALFSGCFGARTGVVTHGGAAGSPRPELLEPANPRGFPRANWMGCLRRLGLRTATVSPFPGRHGAGFWRLNFDEVYDPGRKGRERAGEISGPALDWLGRHARGENWFLHVNFWDPHRPFRTPEEYGDPFSTDPLPAWLTEEVRQRHWGLAGPNSAREILSYASPDPVVDPICGPCPRQPSQCDSMEQVRRMFDGYDTGIRYADEHLGRLLNALADAGVLDDTAVIVSADHGENLGELGCYCDHGTADEATLHVPLLFSWPGVTRPGSVDAALRYHLDLAPTVLQCLGAEPPSHWDGIGFAADLRSTQPSAGRKELVMGQALWTCQRAILFGRHLAIRTWHDGFHGYPEWMVFDVERDPHEERDLAPTRPDLVEEAARRLEDWGRRHLPAPAEGGDPMATVMAEGGPLLARGRLPSYLERLRATGRGALADRLAREHPPAG